ncbi:hypothetical protein SUGI_0278290 [Cryptomeria japonica]|nr:hypothetical protein SUGI_0278290 [Cryptomeria japonica]
MEQGGILLLPAGLSVWQSVDGGGGGSAHPTARKENTCLTKSRAVHCTRAIAEYVATLRASVQGIDSKQEEVVTRTNTGAFSFGG